MWSIQTCTLGGPLTLHGIPVHGDGTTHGTADLTGAVLIGLLTGIHTGILTSAGIGMTTGGIIITTITSIRDITLYTVRYIILPTALQ